MKPTQIVEARIGVQKCETQPHEGTRQLTKLTFNSKCVVPTIDTLLIGCETHALRTYSLYV